MNDFLSSTSTSRYDRHYLLPAIGREGQEKLLRSSVLVVGAGGLGSPVALYLAAAGVGRLGIVDPDSVEITNLQRQILHHTSDLNRNKVQSAKEKIADLNPDVRVDAYPIALNEANAEELLHSCNMAAGCLDNFVARYALNRACITLGKPNIFGAASNFEGQVSVFCHEDGPCYQCFFREPPPSDWRPSPEDKGVLSTVPGVIGCIQATEIIKTLLNIGGILKGRLLLYDALGMRFRELPIRKDPDCPICGNKTKG